MKEKIKELLAKTQAFGPGGETMDRYNCSLYDLEKFAELIVQECAVLCRWEHEAHAMLEHFGVEE